ncbi:hypothetical protein HYPSUDRAFT_41412, partial [Hypholoma sublateritium FD-334 SS-4]
MPLVGHWTTFSSTSLHTQDFPKFGKDGRQTRQILMHDGRYGMVHMAKYLLPGNTTVENIPHPGFMTSSLSYFTHFVQLLDVLVVAVLRVSRHLLHALVCKHCMHARSVFNWCLHPIRNFVQSEITSTNCCTPSKFVSAIIFRTLDISLRPTSSQSKIGRRGDGRAAVDMVLIGRSGRRAIIGAGSNDVDGERRA